MSLVVAQESADCIRCLYYAMNTGFADYSAIANQFIFTLGISLKFNCSKSMQPLIDPKDDHLNTLYFNVYIYVYILSLSTTVLFLNYSMMYFYDRF